MTPGVNGGASELRLLLLSGGCRVGQNVLRTLAGRRGALRLIATSSVADEPALFEFDAVHLAPPTAAEPAAFERRVLAIIEDECPDLVIPCRDDDVLFLASLRDRRPELARRLLCGSFAAAQAIADKWLSAQFCASHHLPFAPTIGHCPPEEQAAFVGTHGFPLVAKPRRGHSSGGIRLIVDAHQLARALAREDYVAQRFLGDPRTVSGYLEALHSEGIPLFHTFQTIKYSVQTLIAPDGSLPRVFCTRNQLNLRRAKRVSAEPDPVALDIGRAIAPPPLPAREAHEGLAARAAEPGHVDALARDGVWIRVVDKVPAEQLASLLLECRRTLRPGGSRASLPPPSECGPESIALDFTKPTRQMRRDTG